MNVINITESESLYHNLEKMSVGELLAAIHEEDKKVIPAVGQTLPVLEPLVEGIVSRMKRGGRLFYVGAGTSGRLGILDASEVPPTYGVSGDYVIGIIAGGDRAIRHPVEAAEDNEEAGWTELTRFNASPLDTVIGIAASGRTPFVIGAVKHARKNGLLTGCITNNPDTELSHSVDFALEAIVGPEFVTGSTRMKSGTAQKLLLNMITTSVMIQLGRVRDNKMVNMQLTNSKLVMRGTRMLVEQLHCSEPEARRLLLLHGSVAKALESVEPFNRGTV
ncbi:MAG: N-acetylmuramic acid 6-phosphate etherase [Bacteroidales bacterium]|jgi:N-acetylmuramic acid 6-phosphate etherase|nr:N-acetylmuramic acid 6-phosphate etherase [Bacteroidales bacterium]